MSIYSTLAPLGAVIWFSIVPIGVIAPGGGLKKLERHGFNSFIAFLSGLSHPFELSHLVCDKNPRKNIFTKRSQPGAITRIVTLLLWLPTVSGRNKGRRAPPRASGLAYTPSTRQLHSTRVAVSGRGHTGN